MAFLDSLGPLRGKTREEIEREQQLLLRNQMQRKQRTIDSAPAGAALLVDSLVDALKSYDNRQASDANKAFGADLLARAVGGQAPAQAAPVSGAPAPSQSQDGILAQSSRNVPQDITQGIASTAQALGISPVDLATVISYETKGTFNPVEPGPTTQWGQHRGLIQFGEPQAKQYGVDWNNPIGSQLGPDGAVAKYLRDRGVKPGMGLMDIYSTVNAGAPGLYDRSDANNGGAPGTVADKVNTQMAGHRQRAMAMFGPQASQRPELQQLPAQGNAPVPDNPLQNLPAQGGQPVANPEQLLQQTPAVYQSTRGQDPRNAVIAAGQGMGQPAPEQPPQVIQAPPQAGVQQALAQQPQAPQPQRGPSQQELMAALSSGRLDPQQEQIVTMLIKQQQARDNAAREQQMQRDQFTWEQQQRQRDPAYQAQLAVQQRNAQLAQAGQSQSTADLDYRAKQAGLKEGTDEYRQFYASGGRGPLVQNNIGGGTDAQIFTQMQGSAQAAQAAATGMSSLQEAKQAVNGGIISGAFADQRLGLQKVASLLGAGDVNAITNTETFRSAIAPQVSAMLKSTVGTTQISNADREFAEKAAGGSISLDSRSISKLIDIMERGNRGILDQYGKQLDAVYPDNGKFTRERALFGIRQPEARPTTPPIPGEIRKGYRFMGGNPADPNSWQRAQ